MSHTGIKSSWEPMCKRGNFPRGWHAREVLLHRMEVPRGSLADALFRGIKEYLRAGRTHVRVVEDKSWGTAAGALGERGKCCSAIIIMVTRIYAQFVLCERDSFSLSPSPSHTLLYFFYLLFSSFNFMILSLFLPALRLSIDKFA
jgi:hypothetical protein